MVFARRPEQGHPGGVGTAAGKGLEHCQEGAAQGNVLLSVLVHEADDATHDALSGGTNAIPRDRYNNRGMTSVSRRRTAMTAPGSKALHPVALHKDGPDRLVVQW